MKYTKEWRIFTDRLGRFIDMDNDYKTMNRDFMDSVWYVFAELAKKNYVYEGKKVVAYSGGLGTPLSNFEVEQNYVMTDDPSLTLSFPLVNDPSTILLVWTTTPWTIPTNIAIAVKSTIEYIGVKKDAKTYIIAKALASAYFSAEELAEENIITMAYEKLVGQKYFPMFEVLGSDSEKSYQIIESDHVSDDAGTGLVHISPAFGQDDYELGLKHELPILDFLNENGLFKKDDKTAEIKSQGKVVSVGGNFFKDADEPLMKAMKEQKRIFKKEIINHSYPFCPRSQKPLFYRALPTWFIEVKKVKDDLVKNNRKINWYPAFVGENRFEQWLMNAKDWAVSRNRYWGSPVPIWRNIKDSSDYIVISSRQELEKLAGIEELTDIHREFVDDILIKKGDKTYKRVSEVFDCWFESGAMPYAEGHFPFEMDEKTLLESHLPADFIAEGIDQTRGWFYTLLVLSTMLYDRPPYKNCVVIGTLLGNDGKKMSKRDGNYTPLEDAFNTYGADAIRFALLNSPSTQATDFALKEESLHAVVRVFLLPVHNIYHYFSEQANKYNFKLVLSERIENLHALDKWMLYRIEQYKAKVIAGYDTYNTMIVCKEVLSFVTDLSTWYVRNIKHTMKEGGKSEVINAHLNVLHYALETVAVTVAPITPFIAEMLYENLGLANQYGYQESVHLQLMPTLKVSHPYELSYQQIELTRSIIELVNTEREKQEIQLRQPLASITLPVELKAKMSRDDIDVIKNETNVENVLWSVLSAVEGEVTHKVMLNFKKLGVLLKRDMQDVVTAIEEKNYELSDDLKKITVLGHCLSLDEAHFSLIENADTENGLRQKNDLWIKLDLKLTPELIERGNLRDFTRALQNLRKAAKCKWDDFVEFYIDSESLPKEWRNLITTQQEALQLIRYQKILLVSSSDLVCKSAAVLHQIERKGVLVNVGIHVTKAVRQQSAHVSVFSAAAPNQEGSVRKQREHTL